MGYQPGYWISTGQHNVLLGAYAGGSLTTGSQNIAIGYGALTTEDAHGRNVAIGQAALQTLNAGIDAYNTAIGWSAGMAVTTGVRNTFVGGSAGDVLAGGENNTFIGYNTGDLTTGVETSTFIGSEAGTGANYSGRNLTCLGYDSKPSAVGASDELTLGSSGVATLRCAVNTITLISDERDKTDIQDIDYGLDLIENLKPRKFTWNSRNGGKQGQKEIGFIAQELQEVDDEYLNFVLDSNPDRLEAGWMQLVPVLVKAVQELSAEVKELKQQLNN